MRINMIHIENFGKLHDFDMDFHNGINIIRASNGWGKTTLAAFLKAMLYGLDYTTKRSLKENERKKYAPWQGGAFGGNMEFMVEEKSYRVERFFGVKDKEDTFLLYDLDTGLESRDYSERLGEELFRLDRAAFERSSFFAQQDFAASLNDSLNARLTRVEEDAGDMQNYEKAVASLEERMKYFQKTGNRGHIAQLEQQRQQVLDELAKCRNKEAAVAEWKEKISAKEQQEEELRVLVGRTEDALKKVQEYAARAERKERYEQLRQQAGVREEQLRRIGVELAQFSQAPLIEEMLDRCHEGIYRLHTLCLQEAEAEEKVKLAEKEIQRLKDAKDELPHRLSGKVTGLVAGLFILAAVLLAAVLGWYLPGALVFVIGCGILWYVSGRNKEAGKQIDQWEEESAQKEQKLQGAQQEYEEFQKNRIKLEVQIRKVLGVSADVPADELEYYWKLERQKSQEYVILKQNYKIQEKETRKSKEQFLEYAGRFSGEELQEFENLQKPEQEAWELQKALEQYRRRREGLLEEKNSLKNQMQSLKDSAERIPELEEESERLAQKLAEETREHGLLEKTVKYLKNAREQFSTRYLKELQQGLEKYLVKIEPGQQTIPALDVKLKVKMREAGASRDLEYFSAGWQDMIQIAERFSIVDALYEEEQPVLILDDPFVNLDTEKQGRAMELLESLTEKWQMIYFTCHE